MIPPLRERELNKTAEEQHPVATVGNIGGAVLLPVGAGAGAAAAGAHGGGAGTGAVLGGAAGAGEGQGVDTPRARQWAPVSAARWAALRRRLLRAWSAARARLQRRSPTLSEASATSMTRRRGGL
jgi:hypothetical protein